MKIKLILLLLLSYCPFAFAQNIDTLKKEAQNMYQATLSMNFDAIIEGTYPRLFELVPKEQMKELLIATFAENEEMKVELISVPANFSFGEIKKIGEQTFCLINHDLKMKLTLVQKVEDDEIELMTTLMKEAMETNDIVFNKENNAFSILKKAAMIAIVDDFTQNEWKFINKDKNNAFVNKLFNEKVIQELGL
jgi:hypothetical protein